ncbi:uncharacterized protein LOC116843634 isoform X2 [Odontomachus brunneus]|uniref:uncharacterized protein LOC116843634 isoform X2 n=1 Tax=Odontomachus brunneus TaxID=486640 RepID=UPI0013F20E6D|nr:uncharacterized protein LOC116843634 isoform X2 [Odontomachus brunneus]
MRGIIITKLHGRLVIPLSYAMPSNCTAFNCCNRSDEGYALFRYPQDETMKRKWIVMVGRGKNWSPSSSQKLCEVHFKPAEIEFFAGRKRLKLGSVPSRFCSCSSRDPENYDKKLRKKAEYRNSLYEQQASIRNNCCAVMQPPLRKNVILIQQEEFIEEVCKFEDNTEEIDQLQPVDENENLLKNIIDENKQLRYELKEIVKNAIKVNKKYKEMDVTDEHRKIYEENSKLKEQVQILSKHVQIRVRLDGERNSVTEQLRKRDIVGVS